MNGSANEALLASDHLEHASQGSRLDSSDGRVGGYGHPRAAAQAQWYAAPAPLFPDRDYCYPGAHVSWHQQHSHSQYHHQQQQYSHQGDQQTSSWHGASNSSHHFVHDSPICDDHKQELPQERRRRERHDRPKRKKRVMPKKFSKDEIERLRSVVDSLYPSDEPDNEGHDNDNGGGATDDDSRSACPPSSPRRFPTKAAVEREQARLEDVDWTEVGRILGSGCTPHQLHRRYAHSLGVWYTYKPGHGTGKPWTAEEDAKIVDLVGAHRDNIRRGRIDGTRGKSKKLRWIILASEMPGRTGPECAERWHDALNPELKHGPLDEEEERIVVAQYEKVGGRWTDMSKLLPGRTGYAIMKHWHASLQDRVEKDENARNIVAVRRADDESSRFYIWLEDGGQV